MTRLPLLDADRRPSAKQQFAFSVVVQLRNAGFEALWAGGCVRDAMLGKVPKDYDVACSATPDDVIRLFGTRRTVAVGASFGVVMVLGPTREAGEVEVATFRSDGTYRDGRRPDSVRYSTPQEDAQRRDLTINGMFYDPVGHEVIDFVGGQADLIARRVRAIGNPAERFAEDKLRMLRAVRFAAALNFDLDQPTLSAIADAHSSIWQVSAERITQELRLMFSHPGRGRAVSLLKDTGLLRTVFPDLHPSMPGAELESADSPSGDSDQAGPKPRERHWDEEYVGRVLAHLHDDSFESSFAVLLSNLLLPAAESVRQRTAVLRQACRQFRLSNEETDAVCWLTDCSARLSHAAAMPKHLLKPMLSHSRSGSLLAMNSAIAAADGQPPVDAEYCRRYLSQTPADVLNPPALITGRELTELGITPGPRFAQILNSVRVQQLNEQIDSQQQAMAWVQHLLDSPDDLLDV